MEPSWLIAIIVVMVACIAFLVRELFRQDRQLKYLLKQVHVNLLHQVGYFSVLSEILVREGVVDGAKMGDGQVVLLPPNLSAESRAKILGHGTLMEKGGGWESASQLKTHVFTE